MVVLVLVLVLLRISWSLLVGHLVRLYRRYLILSSPLGGVDDVD